MREYRNASGMLTFEFDKIESKKYKKVTKRVVDEFQLSPLGELTVGLDEIFQEYESDGSVIGLEWDNWSGYIVTAKNIDSESLARKVASDINDKEK